MSDVAHEGTDVLLGRFTDLMNMHGRDAPETNVFERTHQNNLELVFLMRTAREVSLLFEQGRLD